MFEKYNAIRNASVDYFANSGHATSLSDLLTDRNVSEHFEKMGNVVKELEKLSQPDLVEFTGVIFFGRDAVEWKGSPESTLARTIVNHAHMANEDHHIDYLASKPLHDYLEEAEAKLTGNWPRYMAEQHDDGESYEEE